MKLLNRLNEYAAFNDVVKSETDSAGLVARLERLSPENQGHLLSMLSKAGEPRSLSADDIRKCIADVLRSAESVPSIQHPLAVRGGEPLSGARVVKSEFINYVAEPVAMPELPPEAPPAPVAAPAEKPAAPVELAAPAAQAVPPAPAAPAASAAAAPAAEQKPALTSDDEVLANTALLWKYLPIPEGELEPYPEYKTEQKQYAGGRVVGARVRGKKHKHEGTNSDDWFETGSVGDWVLIAVSDGAGSCRLSRIGAKAACEAALKTMAESLSAGKDGVSAAARLPADLALPFDDGRFTNACGETGVIVQDAMIAARAAVAQAHTDRLQWPEYKDSKLEFKDFSCTLLLAMALPVRVDGREECFVAACRVGDGAIAVVDASKPYGEALRVLGSADSGSFAGETEFITGKDKDRREKLQQRTFVTRRRADYLMVMTDGVADDYFPENPGMLRLLMDLRLNGIVGPGAAPDGSADLSLAPEPVRTVWQNDHAVTVETRYAKKVSAALSLPPEALWEKPGVVAALAARPAAPAEQALCSWLDNYQERSSFDDRTLVILEAAVCGNNG